MVDKNTSLSIGVKYLFYFGANCVEVVFLKTDFHFWTNCPEVAFIKSVQNERAAIMVHDVRRGLGMFPKQAIFAKMSKPVQVYIACQFENGQNITLNYSQLENNSPYHLWSIRPQAEIFFLLF